MALNEISFYNTNGDEINITNLVNQMINYYQMKLEVDETAITDFNEGSEIRNLLEAFAVCIYALLEEQHEVSRIAFIQSSYGNWLDKIGELPFIDMTRITGSPSEGLVTFTLAVAQESDYVIPAGTIVTDNLNNMDFTTLADAIILAGDTTVDAYVECLLDGTVGNVPAGSINTIEEGIVDTNLVSVNNAEAMINGEDYEEDDDYRERMLDNVQADGFGTVGYYESLCTDVEGVHDVKLVNATGYTRKVLVNAYDKPTPDTVLLDVLTELTNLDNIVLGHNFTVGKPTYSTHNLAITMTVVTELSDEELVDNLKAFVDGNNFDRMEYEGLYIEDDLTREQIIGAFSIFPDIVEVTSIKENGSEITTLSPGTNAVLKLGTISITQNEV